jgi:hypothetical protein
MLERFVIVQVAGDPLNSQAIQLSRVGARSH